MLPFPFYFSSGGIDGAECAGKRGGIIIRKIGAAIISVTRFVGLRRSAENVTLLPRSNVEKLRLRIVSGRHPVGRTRGARAHAIPFQRRGSVLARNGSAARIFRIAPGHFCKRVRRNEFSIGAINHIEKTVAIRLQDEVAITLINHDGHLGGVVIVFIVLGELKIPFELARFRFQCE